MRNLIFPCCLTGAIIMAVNFFVINPRQVQFAINDTAEKYEDLLIKYKQGMEQIKLECEEISRACMELNGVPNECINPEKKSEKI